MIDTMIDSGFDNLTEARDSIASRPAQEQPTWECREARGEVMAILGASAPLVSEEEIMDLRAQLMSLVVWPLFFKLATVLNRLLIRRPESFPPKCRHSSRWQRHSNRRAASPSCRSGGSGGSSLNLVPKPTNW